MKVTLNESDEQKYSVYSVELDEESNECFHKELVETHREIENGEVIVSKIIDEENLKGNTFAKKLLACHIEFDHLQEKLFIQGDITYDKLFGIVSHFCQQSKIIRIETVILRHKSRNELLSIINKRTEITTIEIDQFKCSDHEVCTAALPLNLSEHDHLKVFELKSPDISDIILNADQVNTFKLGSHSPKTKTSELMNNSDKDVGTFTNTLQHKLHHTTYTNSENIPTFLIKLAKTNKLLYIE